MTTKTRRMTLNEWEQQNSGIEVTIPPGFTWGGEPVAPFRFQVRIDPNLMYLQAARARRNRTGKSSDGALTVYHLGGV